MITILLSLSFLFFFSFVATLLTVPGEDGPMGRREDDDRISGILPGILDENACWRGRLFIFECVRSWGEYRTYVYNYIPYFTSSVHEILTMITAETVNVLPLFCIKIFWLLKKEFFEFLRKKAEKKSSISKWIFCSWHSFLKTALISVPYSHSSAFFARADHSCTFHSPAWY